MNVLRVVFTGVLLLASISAHSDESETINKLKAVVAERGFGEIDSQPVVNPITTEPEMAGIAAFLQQVITAAHQGTNQAAPPLSTISAMTSLRLEIPDVKASFRENGTIRHITAKSLAQAARSRPTKASVLESSESTTRNFIRLYRPLFQLQQPDEELTVERQEVDAFGFSHVRFLQRFRGLPVWPSGLSAHFDSSGHFTSLDAALAATPVGSNIEPRLTLGDAIQRAKARLPGGWTAESSTPELIIFALLDVPPRLAWKLNLTVGLSHAWRIVVDAEDGRILHKESLVMDTDVAGRGLDMSGVSRNLRVWQDGSRYYLINANKPSFKAASQPIKDPQGAIVVYDAHNSGRSLWESTLPTEVSSLSATTWTPSDAVSAAWNFSETYDYYSLHHGRNSLDGKGGNILAIVRVSDEANASFNGALSMMFFGTSEPFADSLDVVAHELTHGVVQNSAGLIYQNEPGALNESFADILGEMTEARTFGKPDWLIGSRLSKAYRDLKTPSSKTSPSRGRPYPARMSEYARLPNTDADDHGGVHFNSSIINHCFYLLAEGLPGAIGLGDAEKIFYRALTQHLQAQSQFIDCRLAIIASAEELFGRSSPQALKSVEAFDAVEIYAAPSSPDPTPVPVVAAPDSTLFVDAAFFGGYDLRRWETTRGDGASGTRLAADVSKSRPAVTGDGQVLFFVTKDHDLVGGSTASQGAYTALGRAGFINSVAISPNGRYFAIVLRNPTTGKAEDRISIGDLQNNTSSTFNLVSPTLDGAAIDRVLYADSMTFSTDSSTLVYDALSRVRFSGGNVVEKWSIYALTPASRRISIVIPPLEGIDTGNPAMGRAGNRYLAFDAFVEQSKRTVIAVADLFAGVLESVGVVDEIYGYPSFSGDENAIVYAALDGSIFGSGVSLYRQALAPNRLGTIGSPTLWQEDAYLGVVYRRGSFTGANALPTVTLNVTAITPIAGSSVQLQATASDADGSVKRVEFYDGSTKIGDAVTPVAGAYFYSWNASGVGQHRIIARAVDNLGAAGDSTPVVVQVVATAPNAVSVSAKMIGLNVLQFVVTANEGVYDFEQSLDLKEWLKLSTVTVPSTGEATTEQAIEDGMAGGKFFRLRKL